MISNVSKVYQYTHLEFVVIKEVLLVSVLYFITD